LSYVEHVDGSSSRVQAKLVSFTTATQSTSMYWDDFSDSSSEDKDLRKTGHGLRSYYGYCYNGGTPTTALVETTGVLGWTTDNDQSTAEKMKVNDLLWSATTSSVPYDHASKSTDAHGTIEVPFTHAMSKFTIVVVAGDGFKAEDLDDATVTLSGMNVKGTFTAPTSKVTVDVPTDGTTTVKMYGNTASTTTDNKPCRAYEAVVVPLTALASGTLLATIENMSGNKYEVNLSDAIIKSWDSNSTTSLTTQSGINYKLTVTLNKQAVGVVASLATWSDVSATGTSEIQFTANVDNITEENDDIIKDGDSFSLWKSTTKSAFGSIATKPVYDKSNKVFNNPTAIYWDNGKDEVYFRALAVKTSEHELTSVESNSVSQNTDLLWGTTAKHTGTYTGGSKEYEEGDPINPRTGYVPLVFKHAMSNVVIKLESVSGNAAVTLTGATFKLTKLSTKGTIDLAEGEIATEALVADALTGGTSETSYIMVPQTITDDAKLIITLADNTTYSIQLNTCKDGTNTAIAAWESGSKYTYTITLAKEAVIFRVMVQKWDEKEGSGNATLDWD
jgi:hypothetical protein